MIMIVTEVMDGLKCSSEANINRIYYSSLNQIVVVPFLLVPNSKNESVMWISESERKFET